METNQILTRMQSISETISTYIVTYLSRVTLRVLEILVSFVGLVIISPLFLLIAILIKRDSPGPILFRGLRAGKNGEPFYIFKFRTMYERPKSYQGAKVTAQDDPRITPIGRWLRETKINEFPQLWNVLKGEMSLVGPRPEDIDITKKWSEDSYRELLSVRPGITSPASIVYRDEESLLQSKIVMDRYLKDILPSKLRLDLIYVRNRSLMTDLDVIFWTLVALLPQLNRITIPEHLLFWGPLSRFQSRYFSWLLKDILVAFTAIGIAGVIWRISAPLDLGIQLAAAIAFISALLFSLINSLLGLPRVAWETASPMHVFDLAFSSVFVTAAIYLINHIWPSEPLLPPNMLVVAGLLTFFGFVAVRYRSRLLTGLATRWLNIRGSNVSAISERVIIVGANDIGQFSSKLLRWGTLAPLFSIVGMVDDNPRKMGAKVDGCAVIGRTKSIPELVKRFDIGLILFAISEENSDEQQHILSLCRSTPARLVLMSDLMETLRAHFPLDDLEKTEMSRTLVRQATTDTLTGTTKREHFFDLAACELRRAHRYQHPLSLIMFDVDYARDGDEVLSFLISDQALRFAARRCQDILRESDIFGRFSEQEFIIILPETNLIEAKIVAQRIWNNIMSNDLKTDRGPIMLIMKMHVNTLDDEIMDAESLSAHCEAMKTTIKSTSISDIY